MDVDCSEVSKAFLLERYGELLDIPAIKVYLCLTLKATMVKFRDRIAMYMNLKNKYRELAYGEMRVCESEAQIRHITYRFDLHRKVSGRWHLTKIEPDIPEGRNVEDMVPTALVSEISRAEIDPDRMQVFNGSFHTSAGIRDFEVQFTRYSEDHILGTVRHLEARKPGNTLQKKIVPLESADIEPAEDIAVFDPCWYYKDRTDEENFDDLFGGMLSAPEIKESIFRYYFTRLKPVMSVNKRIQATSG